MIAMSLEQQIKDKALELGFDAVGITDASPIGPEHVEHFETWLRSGYAGRMDYMHRNLDKRVHPAKLLEGAQSVIVVALGYKPPESMAEDGQVASRRPQHNPDPPRPSSRPEALAMPPLGKVAQYAQYEDYHPFLKSLLGELVNFIQARAEGRHRFKICVDSAPLAEKALAVRAGLGAIGRNHLLIHPQLGPQILLGEIVTTLDLRPDNAGRDAKSCVRPCTGCDRCLRACPTGALRPDGFLDARRCISYVTQYGAPEEGNDGIVEYWNNGEDAAQSSSSPVFQHSHPPRWLFGCDECLLACPFQQAAPASGKGHFKYHRERAGLNLQEVLELTLQEFEARFHDSPVRRLGLETLKRNARRCLEL
jgi:epoxyqueuosine reductase